jgi:cyclase
MIRIIPRLDIKGPNLVKGIHLEGLRVLGKPADFANFYFQQGADELLYVDVVASLYNRNSLEEIISQTAEQIFIPLTVQGGIRTIEDIKRVLRAGADKVAINTAAINNPQFIQQAAQIFGSSTIVVAIEAIKQGNGQYLAFTNNGREYTGKEVVDWAREVEKLGAGEILLTSVDQEGTGEGFDLPLIKLITDSVSVPVVASGGAGSVKDVLKVMTTYPISGVSLASLFHYDFIAKNKKNLKGYQEEGNIEFLKKNTSYSKIKPLSIKELKQFLARKKVPIRK